MLIQITIKSVYGEDKAYPVNHEAKCMANIAGTKTLTHRALRYILEAGATVEVLDRYGKVSRTFHESTGEQSYQLPMVA